MREPTGVRVVVVSRGRLLLVQHHDRAAETIYWCPPRGRERGETVEEAAVREVYEETGVRVRVIRHESALEADQIAVVVAESEEHREAQSTVDLSAEQYLIAASWHHITADQPLGPLQPEWWNWLAPVIAARCLTFVRFFSVARAG